MVSVGTSWPPLAVDSRTARQKRQFGRVVRLKKFIIMIFHDEHNQIIETLSKTSLTAMRTNLTFGRRRRKAKLRAHSILGKHYF